MAFRVIFRNPPLMRRSPNPREKFLRRYFFFRLFPLFKSLVTTNPDRRGFWECGK